MTCDPIEMVRLATAHWGGVWWHEALLGIAIAAPLVLLVIEEQRAYRIKRRNLRRFFDLRRQVIESGKEPCAEWET